MMEEESTTREGSVENSFAAMVLGSELKDVN
jgi:hypothetical protein